MKRIRPTVRHGRLPLVVAAAFAALTVAASPAGARMTWTVDAAIPNLRGDWVVTTVDATGRPDIATVTGSTRNQALAARRNALEESSPSTSGPGQEGGARVIVEAAPARVYAATDKSNDPGRGAAWHLDLLRAEAVWATQTGRPVVVAVVDSGVSTASEDLRAVTLPGIDITGAQRGAEDQFGHGTAVASTIAAVADNRIGTAGLAQGVRILPVKVLDAHGLGYEPDFGRGLVWAVDHGARVVNISLGFPTLSQASRAALDYASKKDVVVVVSSGNKGGKGSPVQWPGNYPGVVSVAASQPGNGIATFSTRSSNVSVAAPGSASVCCS